MKLHIKENTASIQDMNIAAKQCADEALKNIKQGIEDFEIEVNTKLDRPSFWKKFRQEMTNNGLDFEIKERDTAWSDHYYYMYLYNLNNDLDEGWNEPTEEKPYAEVQVGMKWSQDEFLDQCTKIRGNKAWVESRWNSLDSDEEHREVTIYDIVKGDNCDILVDPKYPNEWYGKIYVNSAINLEQFYPDYWDSIL